MKGKFFFWKKDTKKMERIVFLPHVTISVVSWLQLLFSMNRYRGMLHFSSVDLWSLLLFLHSGVVRWVSALAAKTSSFSFQIWSASVATVITWTAFVIVFNGGFVIPTRQQWMSMVFSLVVAGMWEVSYRLVLEL